MLDIIYSFLLAVFAIVGLSMMALGVVILASLAHHEPDPHDRSCSEVLTQLHRSAARDMVREGYQADVAQIAADIHRREAQQDICVLERPEDIRTHLNKRRN